MARWSNETNLSEGLGIEDRKVFGSLRVDLEEVGAAAERHRRVRAEHHLVKKLRSKLRSDTLIGISHLKTFSINATEGRGSGLIALKWRHIARQEVG